MIYGISICIQSYSKKDKKTDNVNQHSQPSTPRYPTVGELTDALIYTNQPIIDIYIFNPRWSYGR